MNADDDGAPASRAVLRLATLNIQHGCGNAGDRAGGPVNASAMFRALEDVEADVLALQEVDVEQSRTGAVNQAAVVAAATGLPHYRFAAAVEGDVRSSRARARTTTAQPGYGVALLSRFPVVAWFAQPLPGIPRPPGEVTAVVPRTLARARVLTDEPRVLLAALVRTPSGRLVAAATHLSRIPAVASMQLAEVRRRVAGLSVRAGLPGRPLPAVVLGDLNLRPEPAERAGFTLLARALTHPSWGPDRQVDHALALGSVEAAGPARATRLALSDHALLEVPVLFAQAGRR